MTWRWSVSLVPIGLSLIALAFFSNAITFSVDASFLVIALGVVLSLAIASVLVVRRQDEQAEQTHLHRLSSETNGRVAQMRAELQQEADARVAQAVAEAEQKIDGRVAQMRAELQQEADARVAETLTQAQQSEAARVAQARIEVQQETEEHVVQALAEVRADMTKERHDFYRRLHHEVGNPLQSIEAGTTNLLEATDLETRRNAHESIRSQVMLLGDLVNQLRKLPDIADETKPLEISPLDIRELLEGVVEVVRKQPRAADRTLRLNVRDVRSRLHPVAGDRDLLFLAFRNLLDNALKYTPSGGRVHVEVYESESHIVIELIDNGRGIPSDEVPFVWDELRRATNATGEPGYGMGLALVRVVIDRHGGQREISSDCSPGKSGTTVTIKLPIASDAVRANA